MIKAKNVTGWNMSISTLFGKTPKMHITCGKCNHYYSARFTPLDFKNGYKGFPVAMCTKCHTPNYVPIKIS